ncbi:MAG: hypothetical protein E7670_08330 [Ruminococcaceae bacterium]|nr:hypothetical protein [Oscillospiraceae bacterium]
MKDKIKKLSTRKMTVGLLLLLPVCYISVIVLLLCGVINVGYGIAGGEIQYDEALILTVFLYGFILGVIGIISTITMIVVKADKNKIKFSILTIISGILIVAICYGFYWYAWYSFSKTFYLSLYLII